MNLNDLIQETGTYVLKDQDTLGMKVTGITCDSRHVLPGFLFAALPGSVVNGVDYIPQALERGAAAILVPDNFEREIHAGQSQVLTSENPRQTFAKMAGRFYGTQPNTIAAVTGTNGKTSVVTFLRQIWNACGLRAGSMGTLGGQVSGLGDSIEYPGSLTTPDPAALHKTMREMSDEGVDHLAIEASSHGLDQFRLDGLRVSLAAFTNLSRDHLDYHGDGQSYFDAKKRLFSDLLANDGKAIINADANEASDLIAILNDRGLEVLDYGYAASYVKLIDHKPTSDGQHLSFTVLGKSYDLKLPLTGDFQASNALCALTLAVASGCEADEAVDALGNLQGVRGRLELAGITQDGAGIYVDYAHTPDALINVLKAVRRHTSGQLHVVFGCGGDRDSGKRRPMGEAAAAHADVVIVTDDNPRGEDPATIRKEVLTGCPCALEVGDRRMAIRSAIESLKFGDVLIVAGKGHEQGQIVGDKVLPFDDVSVVKDVLGGNG